MKAFKVSVIVLVYNHQHFILKCLESIVSQKVDFSIEIIISNDGSKDNSNNIIEDFISKNKFENIQFKYFNHKINLGAAKNLKFALEQAKGNYIALCEGDDFWTDENKIQVQTDFLDTNSNYFVHLCDSFIYDNDTERYSEFYFQHKVNNPISTEMIIHNGGNLACTNTVFFRNDIKNCLPFLENKIVAIDRALLLLLMTKGKFWFENKKFGAYRVHSGGLSQKGNRQARVKFNKSNIELLQLFDKWTNFNYHKIIKKEISIQAKNVLYFSNLIENKVYFNNLFIFDALKVLVYKLKTIFHVTKN
jgi:glycosyltransferase involved in cell wall biosynthesis